MRRRSLLRRMASFVLSPNFLRKVEAKESSQYHSHDVKVDDGLEERQVEGVKAAMEGRFDQAVETLNSVACARELNLGRGHPGTLTARANLAGVYLSFGRYGEAEALLKEELEFIDQLEDVGEGFRFAFWQNLGNVHRGTGRNDEAAIELLRALQGMERTLGPAHRDTLRCRDDLSLAYEAGGWSHMARWMEVANARAAMSASDKDAKEALGYVERAVTGLVQAERFADAAPLAGSLARGARRVLGKDHEAAAYEKQRSDAIHYYAELWLQQVYRREGELRALRSDRGPDDPDTLSAQSDLADALRLAGRMNEAISTLQETVTTMERALGPDNHATMICRHTLAQTFVQAGDVEGAIATAEQVLDERERFLGPSDPNTAEARKHLAMLYRHAGMWDEAEALFQHNQPIPESKATAR